MEVCNKPNFVWMIYFHFLGFEFDEFAPWPDLLHHQSHRPESHRITEKQCFDLRDALVVCMFGGFDKEASRSKLRWDFVVVKTIFVKDHLFKRSNFTLQTGSS